MEKLMGLLHGRKVPFEVGQVLYGVSIVLAAVAAGQLITYL